MKITHIIIGLGIGGAELMLKRLVEGLNGKDGMQHSVISLTDLGPVGKQLQGAGISVTALGMKNLLSLPRVFCKLRREIKRQAPDVVQTWMYHADFLGGFVAKSLRVKKIIWNVRNTDYGGRGKMNEFLVKACAYLSKKIPDEIIYVSNSARETHESAGYSKEKSIVIYNGFDIEKYKYNPESRLRLRELFGYKDSDLVICSVGRYSDSKDHINFIKAINIALESNSDIRALMVGLNINENNDVVVNEVGGNKDFFSFLGQRNDVNEIFSASDIFCLHSITEGFPNVLGEAMSSSLPCVTTRAGDAEFILSCPDLTVDIKNSKELSEALIKVASLSKEKRKKIGELNRERVLGNYTLSSIINEYSNLYLE